MKKSNQAYGIFFNNMNEFFELYEELLRKDNDESNLSFNCNIKSNGELIG